MPDSIMIQGRDINTSGDEDGSTHFSNNLKWSLDTVENLSQNTRTQLD